MVQEAWFSWGMAVTKRKGRLEQYLPSLVWEQMVVVAEVGGGEEDITKGNKNTCLEAAQETDSTRQHA